MKTHAIRIHEYGGPEVLKWEEVDLPDPGEGEARICHTAVGLNLIDTYHRKGLYPLELPAGIGSEAAGVVEALGHGVADIGIGDRVVYTGMPVGSYAERRNFMADRLVKIPEGISDEVAASVLLKGLTSWYLLRRSYRVREGDAILLYAAAGGVGSLASQWAKQLGATVIGVVSTDDKAELAKSQGCDHIILSDDDIAARARELTDGEGVAAVYDSVGKDTFLASLDSLRFHGTMVSFGNASGPVEPISPLELAQRGSLYLTRPVLFHFIRTREELTAACGELFAAIDRGMRVRVGQTYALQDAAQAHLDIEARLTTGSTVLLP
ncbi:MAG: NADPH:quinone reductase [Woeseiaceae bacterium]|nr:NADPH:quinone reductase [Woeseiaceae bacterium]NIP19542.1 NADPH:quinone reductase [Woeseiaceae bacterium]NIS88496.1 NADPH:quinone reductase [Woeseiaceae bacterium]